MRELTEQEKRALYLTVALWNAFNALPPLHTMDATEMARDIHNIQNRILSRPAHTTETGAES